MPAHSTPIDERTANAAPTKQLLVDVLTKDIDLIAAIIDLVDNSVDGARRLAGPNAPLNGLNVTITFNDKRFEIADNCGGISLDAAERRAFRFGPDPDDPPDDFSTGQFGVGMKRALFKLGRGFTVRSRAETDRFDMKVTVASWLRRPDWTFPLKNVQSGLTTQAARRGTTIVVSPLKSPIGRQLQRMTVVNELNTQIAQRHQRSLVAGLDINVNGQRLKAKVPQVVCDRKISPWVEHVTLNGVGHPIDVRIVCGVYPGIQRDAGWSVFLNDRAVLLADQSQHTGWGEKEEDKRIPRFHPQYGRFRGFAFLRCEDTTRLPWNTTKTGLDDGDAVYREVLGRMVDAADPVIDFLDDVKKEHKPEGGRYGELGETIRDGKLASVFDLAVGSQRKWKAPRPRLAAEVPEKMRQICTVQPEDLIEQAKDAADVTTFRELADFVFDYFVKNEVR